MNDKLLKKLCGSVLYELAQYGFDGEFVKLEDNKIFIEFNQNYLKDFYFVFADSTEQTSAISESYRLTIYVIPKTLKDVFITVLDSWSVLRFYLSVDEEGITSGSITISDIVTFLNSFKKHYKTYFYMSIVRPGTVDKLPKKKLVKQYYKKYRPINP